jgi:hypothetical protein
MRRFGVTLTVLTLIVAGAAAAWWHWSQPREVRQSPTGGIRDTAAGAAQQTARSDTELLLHVDGETASQIAAGAPVIFTLTLRREAPAGWADAVRLEADGGKTQLRSELLGAPLVFAVAGIQRAELGVSPEEAARIPAGTHVVRAVLQSGVGGISTSLVSNQVELSNQGPGSADATAHHPSRIESATRFFLKAGKYQEAHSLASKRVEDGPASADAYILLGDSLRGLSRDQEALVAYHEALRLVPEDLGESPESLLASIDDVLERLAAKAGKKE